MNGEQIITTAAAEDPKFICGKHPDTELRFVLAGGSGHCARCGYYQQSINHPMPTLPPRPEKVKAKRQAGVRKKTAPAALLIAAEVSAKPRARLIKHRASAEAVSATTTARIIAA